MSVQGTMPLQRLRAKCRALCARYRSRRTLWQVQREYWHVWRMTHRSSVCAGQRLMEWNLRVQRAPRVAEPTRVSSWRLQSRSSTLTRATAYNSSQQRLMALSNVSRVQSRRNSRHWLQSRSWRASWRLQSRSWHRQRLLHGKLQVRYWQPTASTSS